MTCLLRVLAVPLAVPLILVWCWFADRGPNPEGWNLVSRAD